MYTVYYDVTVKILFILIKITPFYYIYFVIVCKPCTSVNRPKATNNNKECFTTITLGKLHLVMIFWGVGGG